MDATKKTEGTYASPDSADAVEANSSAARERDAAAILGARLVNGVELAVIRAAAEAAGRLDRHEMPVSLYELQVAAKALGDDRWLAVHYTLADEPLSAAKLLGEARGSDASARDAAALLRDDGASELLFNWQDEERPADERGMAIGVLAAQPLTAAQADALRELVREMLATHLDGLAHRARAAGYYREAMALTRLPDGQIQFLLYLELTDPDMRTRLHAYPDTEFTRWWNPQFHAISTGSPLNSRAETIMRYSAPGENR